MTQPKTDRERAAILHEAVLEMTHHLQAGEVTEALVIGELALGTERDQVATPPDDDGGNVYEHIADDEARTGLDAFSDCQLGGLPS